MINAIIPVGNFVIKVEVIIFKPMNKLNKLLDLRHNLTFRWQTPSQNSFPISRKISMFLESVVSEDCCRTRIV